jgi:hypothetical protein
MIILVFLLAPPAEARAPAPATGFDAAPPPPSASAALQPSGPIELLREAGIDPTTIACRTGTHWNTSLGAESKAGAAELLTLIEPQLKPAPPEQREALLRELRESLMWRLVRFSLLEGEQHNFGVLPIRGRSWTDPAGVTHPLLIFRSGLTSNPDQPGSCVASLLEAGRVRHIVNLFDGDIPSADLVAAEKRAATAAGASYFPVDGVDRYGTWRDTLKHFPGPGPERQQATLAIARLIREQLLAPGGQPPRGNLHVHCGGGMHRTGIVLGVVDRCLNLARPELVEARYKAHVGWQDEAHPGGFEGENPRFVREFDCRLLEGPTQP